MPLHMEQRAHQRHQHELRLKPTPVVEFGEISIRNTFLSIGTPRSQSQERAFFRRNSCPSFEVTPRGRPVHRENRHEERGSSPTMAPESPSMLKLPRLAKQRTLSAPLLSPAADLQILDWSAEEESDDGRCRDTTGRCQPSYSVGAEKHGLDESPCSPCAFYYSQNGCQNNGDCLFCHMCEPGEFKKQKKLKIARLKIENKERLEAEAECQAQNGGRKSEQSRRRREARSSQKWAVKN